MKNIDNTDLLIITSIPIIYLMIGYFLNTILERMRRRKFERAFRAGPADYEIEDSEIIEGANFRGKIHKHYELIKEEPSKFEEIVNEWTIKGYHPASDMQVIIESEFRNENYPSDITYCYMLMETFHQEIIKDED